MFNKKPRNTMAKNNENDPNVINLIGSGTEINGDVTSNGDIRIDGTLNGNLNTKGKVVIGESGKAKGEITCKNADISGKIEGKIIISELLSLKPSSLIEGDIIANKLAIEPGARFTGNCTMNNPDQRPRPELGKAPEFTRASEQEKKQELK
jgi:cytoskeletal protein CcmA (bactofilin family)